MESPHLDPYHMISQALIFALMMVESGGRNHITNGDAAGCMQIRPCVVVDVNRYCKKHYTLADRFNRRKSIAICKLYLELYRGDEASERTYAMTWRFGPGGQWNTLQAQQYWSHVWFYISNPEKVSPLVRKASFLHRLHRHFFRNG